MSYDLIVFDPETAPRDASAFMRWYDEQAELEESQYNEPERTTPALRAWYGEMIRTYPPTNGPDASEDVDNPKLTDYGIGKLAIYACFAWSEAKSAHDTMFRLAQKHAIGFFDISSNDAQPWFPPRG